MKHICILGLGLVLLMATSIFGSAFDEQPDLIIENIIIEEYGHHVPPGQKFYCRVTNSGEEEVTEPIEVSVQVIRCLFGIFPLFGLHEFSGSVINEDGLFPDESVNIQFAYDYQIPNPFFGIFQFKAEVDPNNMIPESNDSNNDFNDKFQKMFSTWGYR